MRFLIALLFLCAQVSAATLYCSPAGGGSGADFSNLATLPTTTGFTRGNVYVVVDGSYGSKTLSTATSSTTTITIRKANASDSAVTGYASNLHDGVAVFGTLTIRTQYWIVDGITRTESNTWTAPTGYGMSADAITASSGDGDDADNSQFRYMDLGPTYAVNPSAGTINGYDKIINLVFNQTNITFTRCAIHNGKGTLVQGAGSDNLTFEYCDFGPGWGKEAIRGGNLSLSTGWIIRHCRFWNSSQTDPNDGSSGITAEIGIWDADSGSFDGHEVYGNWFFNEHTGGRNAIIVIGGDGVNWLGVSGSNNKVYNNTFAGIADPSAFSTVLLNGGTGNEARNNYAYDNGEAVSYSANTTSNNVAAGADNFVNYATLDLRLAGATTAGFTLSAPYDTDPLGTTRGGDGTWDVGAYEYNAGGGGGAGTVSATTVNAGTVIVSP